MSEGAKKRWIISAVCGKLSRPTKREEAMPQERLSMRKINEVLRLKKACQLSNRAIARSCQILHSTVGECLKRAEAAGISWSRRSIEILAPGGDRICGGDPRYGPHPVPLIVPDSALFGLESILNVSSERPSGRREG